MRSASFLARILPRETSSAVRREEGRRGEGAAVAGLVQALGRKTTAATPERFRQLDRQLDRLARMVGDLLDATRIESGHLELKPEDLDLRDVARAVVDLYARRPRSTR